MEITQRIIKKMPCLEQGISRNTIVQKNQSEVNSLVPR